MPVLRSMGHNHLEETKLVRLRARAYQQKTIEQLGSFGTISRVLKLSLAEVDTTFIFPSSCSSARTRPGNSRDEFSKSYFGVNALCQTLDPQ